jgi:hypothetical protein
LARETHETRLLAYLRENKTITQHQASRKLGNERLSATVFNLRNKGYNIVTVPTKGVNRYGTKTNFGTYKLEG